MSTAPPRLVSDQMINIFLQEWSPLFPVLHRPTFLKLYEDYVACPEGVNDSHAIAQLNLVFGIAALSAEVILQLPSRELVVVLKWSSGTNKTLPLSKPSGSLPWSRFNLRTHSTPYNALSSLRYTASPMPITVN